MSASGVGGSNKGGWRWFSRRGASTRAKSLPRRKNVTSDPSISRITPSKTRSHPASPKQPQATSSWSQLKQVDSNLRGRSPENSPTEDSRRPSSDVTEGSLVRDCTSSHAQKSRILSAIMQLYNFVNKLPSERFSIASQKRTQIDQKGKNNRTSHVRRKQNFEKAPIQSPAYDVYDLLLQVGLFELPDPAQNQPKQPENFSVAVVLNATNAEGDRVREIAANASFVARLWFLFAPSTAAQFWQTKTFTYSSQKSVRDVSLEIAEAAKKGPFPVFRKITPSPLPSERSASEASYLSCAWRWLTNPFRWVVSFFW